MKTEYDKVLFCITNLLLNIHRQFFNFYEKYKFTKSISRIINDTLKMILLKKKFFYHLNFDKLDSNTKKNKKKMKTENENKDKDGNKDNKIQEIESNMGNVDNIIEKSNLKKDLADNKVIDENKDKKEQIKDEKEKGQKGNKISDEAKKKIMDLLKNKIQKLGGELIEEEKDMFKADYFLTDFYDEKDPIIKSIEDYKEKKIHILHCHYIEICLMYFYGVKIEDFILNEKIKYLKYLDLNKVFDKNKTDIINFYGNNDFVDDN